MPDSVSQLALDLAPASSPTLPPCTLPGLKSRRIPRRSTHRIRAPLMSDRKASDVRFYLQALHLQGWHRFVLEGDGGILAASPMYASRNECLAVIEAVKAAAAQAEVIDEFVLPA